MSAIEAKRAKTKIDLKNVLFATDFSPAAEAALPYALGLAKQYGARVHGLHVRFPATYPIVGPEAMPQVMEAAEEQAKFEAQQLQDMLAGMPHEVTVAEGELWPILSNIVKEQQTDLIVMGTHGRTGFSRALLGSAAEEVFRKTTCPVLTVGPAVRHNTDRQLAMKEILYATDFSPASLAALPYAVSLAQEHQSRLTLLHIIPQGKTGELVHEEQYEESTLRRLRSLVPPEADLWCEPQFRIERGPEAEKIMEVAAGVGADLIVLGARSPEGGIGATTHVLRSIAHTVVAKAECPVLTVHG